MYFETCVIPFIYIKFIFLNICNYLHHYSAADIHGQSIVIIIHIGIGIAFPIIIIIYITSIERRLCVLTVYGFRHLFCYMSYWFWLLTWIYLFIFCLFNYYNLYVTGIARLWGFLLLLVSGFLFVVAIIPSSTVITYYKFVPFFLLLPCEFCIFTVFFY